MVLSFGMFPSFTTNTPHTHTHLHTSNHTPHISLVLLINFTRSQCISFTTLTTPHLTALSSSVALSLLPSNHNARSRLFVMSIAPKVLFLFLPLRPLCRRSTQKLFHDS